MTLLTRALSVLALSLSPLLAVAPAGDPTPSPDPKLRQTVAATEASGTGRAELSRGHVDVGPRMTADGWEFLARDDTSTPPVWRRPADILIRVGDKAQLAMPDDKRYAFLGIPAGQKVWIIPQTENRDVVWLGWNSQDPKVTQTIDRGAKLVFHRYTGPGTFHVFLENGFDAPTPLWDGQGKDGQEIWVDVNTHVHANWVFSAPGVYLVETSIVAKAKDGSEKTSTGVMRFAVGDAVSAQDAYAASLPAASAGPASAEPAAAANASAAPGGTAAAQPASPLPWLLTGLGVLLVAAAVAVTALRSRRARAAAQAGDE